MKLYLIVTIGVVAFLLGTILVAVVYNNASVEDRIDDIYDDDTSVDAVGNLSYHDAVNAFSFHLFKDLFNADANQFISAYSIFTALAMTYEGAAGETAEEMKQVLQVEKSNTSFQLYMKDLYDVLNAEHDDFDLSTANALWVRDDIQLLRYYLNIIRSFYGGDATSVDYSQPVHAAEIINQWVENQTNNLITDLISPEMISPATLLILTNAIYFKGIWQTQFEQQNTTMRPFTTSSGSIEQVETMNLIDKSSRFSYMQNDDIEMLELPYSGDDISMMIVLPKNQQLGDIVDMLDYAMFSTWISSLRAHNVEIYLPKFKVETQYLIEENLKNIGMQLPFTANADFSLITGNKDLFISSVVHKAYIEVNEQGTEAAAATGVVMSLSANGGGVSSVVFDCNKPFLYLIYHKSSDTLLFMGTIDNPNV